MFSSLPDSSALWSVIGGGILLIALVVGWAERRRQQQCRLYVGSDRLLPRSRARIWIKAMGWSATFALSAVACSRIPLPPSSHASAPHELLLLIDCSASMGVVDPPHEETRLARAQHFLKELLRQCREEEVSLSAFTSTLIPVSPPTSDHLFIRLAIEQLHLNIEGTTGTRFSSIFSTLFDQILSPPIQKRYTIVLVSDGGDTEITPLSSSGDATHYTALQNEVVQHGQWDLNLFTIGVGGHTPQPIPSNYTGGKVVFSSLEEGLLHSLATWGKGEFFSLEEETSESIARTLLAKVRRPTTEKGKEASPGGHQLLSGIALILYCLTLLLSEVSRHPALLLVVGLIVGLPFPSPATVEVPRHQPMGRLEWHHECPEWMLTHLLCNHLGQLLKQYSLPLAQERRDYLHPRLYSFSSLWNALLARQSAHSNERQQWERAYVLFKEVLAHPLPEQLKALEEALPPSSLSSLQQAYLAGELALLSPILCSQTILKLKQQWAHQAISEKDHYLNQSREAILNGYPITSRLFLQMALCQLDRAIASHEKEQTAKVTLQNALLYVRSMQHLSLLASLAEKEEPLAFLCLQQHHVQLMCSLKPFLPAVVDMQRHAFIQGAQRELQPDWEQVLTAFEEGFKAYNSCEQQLSQHPSFSSLLPLYQRMSIAWERALEALTHPFLSFTSSYLSDLPITKLDCLSSPSPLLSEEAYPW